MASVFSIELNESLIGAKN